MRGTACLVIGCLALWPTALVAQSTSEPPRRLDPSSPILVVPERGPIQVQTPNRAGRAFPPGTTQSPRAATQGRPTQPQGSAATVVRSRRLEGSAAPQSAREAPARTRSALETAPLPPLESIDVDGRANGAPASGTRRAGNRSTTPVDTGLPASLWRGVTVGELAQAISGPIPKLKSPALRGLWRRIFNTRSTKLEGERVPGQARALQLEGLYQLGHFEDAMLARDAAAQAPIVQAVRARSALASGDTDLACDLAQRLLDARGTLPKPIHGEIFQLAAWCAAVLNTPRAGLLVAALAREEGFDAPGPYSILEALEAGEKPTTQRPPSLSPLAYQYLALADLTGDLVGWRPYGSVLAGHLSRTLAGPSASAQATAPQTRIARLVAAEEAAVLGAIDGPSLGRIYRETRFSEATLANAERARVTAPEQRALIFQRARAVRDPRERLGWLVAFMQTAKRDDVATAAAGAIAPFLRNMPIDARTLAAADTVIETLVRSGEAAALVPWVDAVLRRSEPTESAANSDTALASARVWLPLAEIVSLPGARDASSARLAPASRLAQTGRLSPQVLHRLVTVLEALGYNPPLQLWDAASRASEPPKGELPKTGLLGQLAAAADKKDVARTALLVTEIVGEKEIAAQHPIALGDVLRALRRVNLDREARVIAVEAVIDAWSEIGVGSQRAN